MELLGPMAELAACVDVLRVCDNLGSKHAGAQPYGAVPSSPPRSPKERAGYKSLRQPAGL